MVLFLSVLLINLLLRCAVSVSSPHTVKLTVSWADNSMRISNQLPLSLTEDEPFTIYISSDKPLLELRCNKQSNNEIIYFSGLKIINFITVGSFNYVLKNYVTATANMTGFWECVASQDEEFIDMKLLFFVDVTKQIQEPQRLDTNKCNVNSCHNLATCKNTVGSFTCSCPQGYKGDGFACTGIASSVMVNDVNITVTASQKDTTGYDGRGEYRYREGELAKITCMKMIGTMNVRSRYNETIPDFFSTEFLDLRTQTVYVKLTSAYNGSYIDCNVNTKPSNPESFDIVRLYFYKMPSNTNDFPTFSVNGLVLASAKANYTNAYVYEYYEGEVLSIKSSMNKLKCSYIYTYKDAPDKLKGIFKNKSLDLTVTLDRPFHSLCISPLGTFSFDLKPAISIFDPVIGGLSLAQTQMKYQLNLQTYIKIYNNTGNRELNLSCSSVYSDCNWKNNDKYLKDKEVIKKFYTKRRIYKSYYRFIPEKNTNSTNVIECECTGRKYKMVAKIANHIIEPEYVPTPKPEEKDIISSGDPNGQTNGHGSSFNTMFIYLIVGVTLVIVILVTWLIVGIHRRKRRLEQAQASDINYETFDDKPIPPAPSQWDTYANPADVDDTHTYTVPYVAKTVEEMYAKPQPKSQRPTPNETLYAELVELDEPNSASAKPKGEEDPKTDYAKLRQQMPAYGQIQPKKLQDNKQFAPQVLPKLNEDNYAQIVPKSLRNQPESSEYTNLNENQRYANAQANIDDYAEPAYCEVNIKKGIGLLRQYFIHQNDLK